MNLLSALTFSLLFGLTIAAPSSPDNVENKESSKNGITITMSFFHESLVVYKSKHDIVSIHVPINGINFDDDSEDDDTNDDSEITLFFVEADTDSAGNTVNKGLYILNDRNATKILDNGRCADTAGDNSKDVFFGADDGIYTYSATNKTAVKYGSVTDSIIGIAKENGTDVIYILTKDHDVYKVTEGGNKKAKLADVVGAQEIVLDYSNNLYYYGFDKCPYVVNSDGVTKITGLPIDHKSVKLLKPPFVINDGVPFISDNTLYFLFANGTSEVTDFTFKPNAKPSAYAMEATLMQYMGFNKKIYEYNLLELISSEFIMELKQFLEDKINIIQTMATRSRSHLRAH